MKKKRLFLFACCCLVASSLQSQKTTRQTMHLEGKVRAVTVSYYHKRLDETGPFRKKEKTDSASYIFDKNGWLTEKMSSADVANFELFPECNKYEYDIKGNLTKMTLHYLQEPAAEKSGARKKAASFTPVWMVTYSYNEQDKLTEARGYDMPENILRTEYNYVYNEKGAQIEESCRDVKSGKLERTLFSYNKTGQLVTERFLTAGGKTERECRYTYDAKENLAEYKVLGGDGVVRARETYTHDLQNRLTGKTEYDKKGNPEKSIAYLYDERGNELSVTYRKPDGSLWLAYTYQYQYDGQGNWIKREMTENKELIGLIERKIEYGQDPQ